MARRRMIKPEFFTSQPVNNLSPTGMLTFAGLWIYCDDFGRGEDNLALIRAALWARRASHTEKKLAEDLDAIAREGLMHRYVVGGAALLHIPSWLEHQKVNHPTESKLPPCPQHEPGLWDVFRRDSGGPLERFRSGSRMAQESLSEGVPHSVVEVSLDQRSVGDLPLSDRLRDDLAARRGGAA